MNPIPLENGKYYHIYNRGNNGIDLFYETYTKFAKINKIAGYLFIPYLL